MKKKGQAPQPLQQVEPDEVRVYGETLRELARFSGADLDDVDILLQAYLEGALDEFGDEP